MNDEITLRNAVEKLSKEIEELTRQRDAIMNKLSDLVFKRDILIKAEKVLDTERTASTAEGIVMEAPPMSIRNALPLSSQKPEASANNSRGMTKATIKLLLPPNKFLSVREVLNALEQEGYRTKRVNVYIMLRRLVTAGRVISRDEGGTITYGLFPRKKETI
jgi:Fe2+ or Zn2+ uptake regulation protein